MTQLIARLPILLAVSACAVATAVTASGPAAASTSYGVVATIPLGECSSPSPDGVSVDTVRHHIFVVGTCFTTGISTTGEVQEIDGATNQVTASLVLGEGRNSQGILPRVSDAAVDSATDAVYETVSNGVSQVSVVDAATNTLTTAIPISAGVLAADPATNTVYAGTAGGVSVINGATNQVTATIALSAAPVTIATDPATNTVYAGAGNAVSVINGATNQVTATIALSAAPVTIATDPAANTVYAGAGNAVSVIDGATNQVTATVAISSGFSAEGLGVDPSTHTAYLSASGTELPPSGVVYLIGTTTGGGGTGQAPAVSTNAASGVFSAGATLNGSVNPEGQSTTYKFDYGTSTSYGSSVPSPAGSAGSGTSTVNESATLNGLRPGTTYHYRIEATNATGTTDGPDQTFTTARRHR